MEKKPIGIAALTGCFPIPQWLVSRSDISPTAKLCYGALLDLLPETNGRLTNQEVGAYVGLEVPIVREALAELVRADLIGYEGAPGSKLRPVVFYQSPWMTEYVYDVAPSAGSEPEDDFEATEADEGVA